MAQETSTGTTSKSGSTRRKTSPSTTRAKKSMANDSGSKKALWLKIAAGVVFCALIGSTIFFYYQYRTLKNDPTKVSRDEIQSLVDELDKIILLPQGEEPTLATVTESEKLREEAFFVQAKNGDKVLVYEQARKAVLYRPSTKRIIEVMPLNSGRTQQQNTIQETDMNLEPESEEMMEPVEDEELEDGAMEEVKGVSDEADETDEVDETALEEKVDRIMEVALLNGSSRLGYTYELEDKLTSLDGFEIVERAKANSQEYTQTKVIDLGGESEELVNEIAQTLGADVTELPEGEDDPGVDILIIGGINEG